MRKLKNCRVKFHTTNDDKDHDSHLTIVVRDSAGRIAARVDSDFARFPDHSSFETFIPVHNASSDDEMQSGSVTLRLDPNGNDTWKFNCFVELIFDDNFRLGGEQASLRLSQNAREVAFGLQGIVKPL